MIRALQIYERSYCDCQSCSSPCHSQPGALAPSDVDHIADFFDVEPSAEFLTNNFTASMLGDSPAIRPKLREGRCVFLADSGQCTIHPVAPFECQMLSCKGLGKKAVVALERINRKNVDNQQLWVTLKRHEESQSAT